MGSDDQGKDVKAMIASETKGLLVEVYKDVAKRALTQIGLTAEQAVVVALAIPNILLSGAKTGLDRLGTALRRKLSDVPDERLLPPPATIAASAAFQYLLLGDGDEASVLRDMFETLLVTSMDRDTVTTAHPAFASMISQLTPDEAWMLKSIDRTRYEYIDIGAGRGLRTMLGVGIGIEERQISTYVANLVRLGIFKWHEGYAGTYHSDAPAELRQRIEAEFSGEYVNELAVLFLNLTPFGQQFLQACANIKPPQTS